MSITQPTTCYGLKRVAPSRDCNFINLTLSLVFNLSTGSLVLTSIRVNQCSLLSLFHTPISPTSVECKCCLLFWTTQWPVMSSATTKFTPSYTHMPSFNTTVFLCWDNGIVCSRLTTVASKDYAKAFDAVSHCRLLAYWIKGNISNLPKFDLLFLTLSVSLLNIRSGPGTEPFNF